MTSDSPFVLSISDTITSEGGLDNLLNPAKLVNLERKLVDLRLELMDEVGLERPGGEGEDLWVLVRSMTGSDCDVEGFESDVATALRGRLEETQRKIDAERRTVFRGWLKDIFLAQAVLSFLLSYFMAFEPGLLFGSFGWYNDPRLGMEVAVSALGFWWWWLFIIPSLRSRRPQGREKVSLDYAFLLTPLASLVAPAFTTDTGTIWLVDAAVTAGCYAVGYGGGLGEVGKGGAAGWVFKALDVGGGRERGVRQKDE